MAKTWENHDTLREMTQKFNTVVEELTELQESSTQVNQATETRFSELENSMKQQFEQVNEELDEKVSSVTKADIGLGEVDNTSDLNKPVSIAQQQAIDNVIAEMLSSEEAGQEIENDDPEVSAPIKEYINQRIKEIGAKSGLVSYGIATTSALGVVKASDDVNVNESTGVMSVPKLKIISEKLNQAVVEFTKDHEDMGILTELQTENKTTLVAAINETFQLGSEKKAKLVENLTAMGITCSTSDSWETLLGYILEIFTGTDTSDANLTSEYLLSGLMGYGPEGKVIGTMPNLSQNTSIEFGTNNATKVVLADQLFINTNTDGVKRVCFRYASENGFITGNTLFGLPVSQVANNIGLTPEKIVLGNTILDIEGTAITSTLSLSALTDNHDITYAGSYTILYSDITMKYLVASCYKTTPYSADNFIGYIVAEKSEFKSKGLSRRLTYGDEYVELFPSVNDFRVYKTTSLAFILFQTNDLSGLKHSR